MKNGDFPFAYAFIGQFVGLFQTEFGKGFAWIVCYEPDLLGVGPVEIYVSLSGNLIGTNLSAPFSWGGKPSRYNREKGEQGTRPLAMRNVETDETL